MTPEQRALVDGAREKAAKARAYLDELVGDEDKDRTHRELLEVCDTLGSHTAAIRFYAPALCDLADEQASRVASLESERAADRAAFEHALVEREGDLAHVKAELDALKADVAARDAVGDQVARHFMEGAPDGMAAEVGFVPPSESIEEEVVRLRAEVTDLKAERDALETRVAKREWELERLRSVVLAPTPERPTDVLFVPSVQVALDVGLNGFGFKLVGETFVAALPRNPERRAIVVRFRAKGTLVDVEVRLAPVIEEGGAT